MNKKLLLSSSLLMALALPACGDDSGDSDSNEDANFREGVVVSTATDFPNSDVVGVVIEAIAADEATVAALGTGSPLAERTFVPLDNQFLPGNISDGPNVSPPLDPDSAHRFADRHMVLPDGNYLVRATPVRTALDLSAGQPLPPDALSRMCHVAEEIVEVVASRGMQVTLLTHCDMTQNGGLNAKAVLNHAPTIDAVDFGQDVDPCSFADALCRAECRDENSPPRECITACGGDPCEAGCHDAPECDPACGGDNCNAGCPGEGNPSCLPNENCDEPEEQECNFECGGNPCNDNCGNEDEPQCNCDPIENPGSQCTPECGGDEWSVGCECYLNPCNVNCEPCSAGCFEQNADICADDVDPEDSSKFFCGSPGRFCVTISDVDNDPLDIRVRPRKLNSGRDGAPVCNVDACNDQCMPRCLDANIPEPVCATGCSDLCEGICAPVEGLDFDPGLPGEPAPYACEEACAAICFPTSTGPRDFFRCQRQCSREVCTADCEVTPLDESHIGGMPAVNPDGGNAPGRYCFEIACENPGSRYDVVVSAFDQYWAYVDDDPVLGPRYALDRFEDFLNFDSDYPEPASGPALNTRWGPLPFSSRARLPIPLYVDGYRRFYDLDGDGYGGEPALVCDPDGTGYVDNSDDCDDGTYSEDNFCPPANCVPDATGELFFCDGRTNRDDAFGFTLNEANAYCEAAGTRLARLQSPAQMAKFIANGIPGRDYHLGLRTKNNKMKWLGSSDEIAETRHDVQGLIFNVETSPFPDGRNKGCGLGSFDDAQAHRGGEGGGDAATTLYLGTPPGKCGRRQESFVCQRVPEAPRAD